MDIEKKLIRVYTKYYHIFEFIEYLENFFNKNKIKEKTIKRIIFVVGYPRSGTTFLSNLLYNKLKISSIIFKYYPLINIPYTWSWFSSFYFGKNKTHRLQKDNIFYDINTAESLDEIYISRFLKEKKFKLLNESYSNNKLQIQYEKFLKKILILEKNNSLVIKNNYNILRIKYLNTIFPNSKFIIMFRNPINQINSILRVNHILFSNNNKKTTELLKFNEHFEFGEIKIPLNLTNREKTLKFWGKGDLFNGYLQQWIDIYEICVSYYSHMGNVTFINYEDITKSKFKKISLNLMKNNIKLTEKNFLTKFKKKKYKNFYRENKINRNLLKKAQNIYGELTKLT